MDAKAPLGPQKAPSEFAGGALEETRRVYAEFATSKLLWEVQSLGEVRVDCRLRLGAFFRLEARRPREAERRLSEAHSRIRAALGNLGRLASLARSQAPKVEFELLSLFEASLEERFKAATAFLARKSLAALNVLEKETLLGFLPAPPTFASQALSCVGRELLRISGFALKVEYVSAKTAKLNALLRAMGAAAARMTEQPVRELVAESGLVRVTAALCRAAQASPHASLALQDCIIGAFEPLPNEAELVRVGGALQSKMSKLGRAAR